MSIANRTEREMKKCAECENGCLVAEARGVLYACQFNCAYAAGALRAAASVLGAQLKLRDELLKEMSEEDESIRKMVADFDTTDSLNYDDTAAIVERAIYGYKTEIAAAKQRASGLASENQRLKEEIAALKSENYRLSGNTFLEDIGVTKT